MRKIQTRYTETKTREVEVEFPLYMLFEYHPDGGGGSTYTWSRTDAEPTLSASGTIDGIQYSITWRPHFRRGEGEWEYEIKRVNIARTVGAMIGDQIEYTRIPAIEFYQRIDQMKKALDGIPPETPIPVRLA